MLDCGTNHDFVFKNVQEKASRFHRQCIEKNFRYTVEPIKYNTTA